MRKKVDGKDVYAYSFDKRGNLVRGEYQKNKNQSTIMEQYVYDATNRMVKGLNEGGEESHYVYDGLGYLVANEWLIKQNSYGYTGAGAGVQAVRKDYVIDYASPLKNVIMEQESGLGGLTYRYTYGLEKINAVITGIANGAGSVMQYVYDDGVGGFVLTDENPGGDLLRGSIVKLWYHHSRLGTVDFMTDNVQGQVMSFVSYDDWGSPTAKAIIRMGARELDLVTQYTVHPYDQVLGLYFAQARMYDSADRRFVAMDWVGGNAVITQTFNRYAYTVNNPLIFVDVDGLLPGKAGGASITFGNAAPITEVYIDAISGTVYADFFELLKLYGVSYEPVISTVKDGRDVYRAHS